MTFSMDFIYFSRYISIFAKDPGKHPNSRKVFYKINLLEQGGEIHEGFIPKVDPWKENPNAQECTMVGNLSFFPKSMSWFQSTNSTQKTHILAKMGSVEKWLETSTGKLLYSLLYLARSRILWCSQGKKPWNKLFCSPGRHWGRWATSWFPRCVFMQAYNLTSKMLWIVLEVPLWMRFYGRISFR